MTFVKRSLMGLGSIALLALLMALVVPQARAVVATLVQVANTASNPVLSLDTERIIPYQSTQSCTPAGGGCYLFFTTVPSGYRLHAQNLNAVWYLPPGTTTAPLVYLLNASIPATPLAVASRALAGEGVGVINQQITAYPDGGSTPEVLVSGNAAAGDAATVLLNGYLENCAVTNCPTTPQ